MDDGVYDSNGNQTSTTPDGIFDYYEPDVVFAADYYDGVGMVMPGRLFVTEDHRYGAQGSEVDQEIDGSRDRITTYYRNANLKTMRWDSPDPKPNASWSPYAMMQGNPVLYNDVLGDTIKYDGSFGFKLRTKTVLLLSSAFSKDAREKIKDLKTSQNVHIIKKETSDGNYAQSNSYGVADSPLGYVTNATGSIGTGQGTGSTIGWDVTSKHGGENVKEKTKRPKYIGLLHEIFHAWQIDRGEIRRNFVDGVKQSEREAVHFENQMRSQLGRISLRKKYGNIDVLRMDFDYKKNEEAPPGH